uniref:wall-associated receptor kinase 2-like n=1 Tax=Erigeron canadensis TaxID=72917 RepID=UPI001CB8EC3C|nr:wall-associated receptor kinase 2-like [Erigeron canadensis]
MKKFSQQILLLNLVFFSFIDDTYSKPSCPTVDKCGNVIIPYPFSTVDDCYLDESYYIQCDSVTQIPRLNISNSTMYRNGEFDSSGYLEVFEINLDGHLIVALPAAYGCPAENGSLFSEEYTTISVKTSNFPFSSTQNKFIGVGCGMEAHIWLGKSSMDTSCVTNCDHYNDIKNGSCEGSGCCIASSFPKGETTVIYTASDYTVSSYSKCGHGFMVDPTKYNFNVGDLSTMSNDISFPVVLEWFAGNSSCKDTILDNSTYLCIGKSVCQDGERENGHPGYRCVCSDGYSGNPYVNDGCQDVNECESPELNKCPRGYNCKNTEGSYNCVCPKGFHGDAKSGEACTNGAFFTKGKVMTTIFGVAVATIVMGLTYCGIKKWKIIKGREDFFKQNGGIMLQKALFSGKNRVNNNAMIFTNEELKKATDNFSETNIIGQGGYGVVYKGILANKMTIAIKKSKLIDQSQINQFVNEVIILSKINHPNIVKLIGCCLETHVPLLVYEYITNNTLFHHIHNEAMMSFETRLKIATETAQALSYMHSATKIIHRDVKPSNILLNDEFSAKVSDFGISRFVPLELLTGTKIHSLEISLNIYRGAAAYLTSLLERNTLFKVLDKQLKSEVYAEVVKGVAKIAINCLDLEGKNRPTMKEVVTELEHLRSVLSSIGTKGHIPH